MVVASLVLDYDSGLALKNFDHTEKETKKTKAVVERIIIENTQDSGRLIYYLSIVCCLLIVVIFLAWISNS